MLQTWAFDDSTEHLSPIDMYVAQQLLADPSQNSTLIAEVGVWKGAWVMSLLQSRPDATAIGVDPYPGAPAVGRRVAAEAAAMGLAERFQLLDTTAAVCEQHCDGGTHIEFRLIHIDGEHTESAVTSDLAFAARHLTGDGVIVVDDYRFPWFPGIASAMYGFVHDRRWAIFLATDNKAYLCRSDHHERWLNVVTDVLAGADVPWSRGIGQRYPEPPDVRGFPMALCLGPVPSERVLEGLHVPWRYRWQRSKQRWLPPLRETVRPLKRRVRRP